jgi:LPXTG-site transpeptidase (sortase) family protein
LFLFISSWGIGQVVQPTSPPLAVIGGVKPLIATEQAPVITKEAREPVVQAVDIAAYLPTPTPSSLPDYPIPTPSVIPTNAPGSGEPDASAIQRIRIPRLALDTVVKFVPYEGGTWLIGGLKQEVAWMGDTSWPGLGGNTGLAGHVDLADGSDGPFWRLSELKAGDEVLLHTERNVYTYQVREQVVVPDYDMSVIEATEKAQITLITCTGWDTELRTYLQRLIVFADLVSVAPLQTQGN